MKVFNKQSLTLLVLSAMMMMSEAGASATEQLTNGFSGGSSNLHFSQKNEAWHKAFGVELTPPQLFFVKSCTSGGKTGILCNDGFCDTSKGGGNTCNGHNGISPGHTQPSSANDEI